MVPAGFVVNVCQTIKPPRGKFRYPLPDSPSAEISDFDFGETRGGMNIPDRAKRRFVRLHVNNKNIYRIRLVDSLLEGSAT